MLESNTLITKATQYDKLSEWIGTGLLTRLFIHLFFGFFSALQRAFSELMSFMSVRRM